MEKLLLGDGGGEQDAAEVAAHQLSGHSYHLLRGCQKKNITLIFHILSLNGKTQLEEILYFCVYFEYAGWKREQYYVWSALDLSQHLTFQSVPNSAISVFLYLTNIFLIFC